MVAFGSPLFSQQPPAYMIPDTVVAWPENRFHDPVQPEYFLEATCQFEGGVQLPSSAIIELYPSHITHEQYGVRKRLDFVKRHEEAVWVMSDTGLRVYYFFIDYEETDFIHMIEACTCGFREVTYKICR